MYQSTINTARSGIGAEQVKTASFFIKTSLSFAKYSLESYSRPGCKRHEHPDVGKVQARVFVDSCRRCGDVYLPCQRHFYALFLHLIWRKRAFFTNDTIFGDSCFCLIKT
ncbi:hypothetical protein PRABACTJOHN_00033 [Parabacteroides johnsonii DSM 18315]|uniref:Uncharacterized protein n=1 Tax=Parabacteroides johnsonii DSM 18315 TaxID=537006 RepID=B7B4U2_9BACT|nr:hypothetical protein PRABACTJOHN_00033 [Parabacteroides johnsonii DSM 18315]